MQYSHLMLGTVMVALIFGTAEAASWPHPITIDGNFADWEDVPAIYETNVDPAVNAIGIESMKIAHDADFVFFKVQLSEEVNLNENNDLRLYLDTYFETGISFNGIGANLIWRFGERQGFYYSLQPAIHVIQSDISFRAAPSVTSDRFEFAIARSTMIAGDPLFPGTAFRVAMWDFQQGPVFPDPGDHIVYVFDDRVDVPTETILIERESPDDLRIASFNVWNDGLFDASRADSFSRLLQATQPDIIHFQEIYQHSAEHTLAFVNQALPLPDGESWHAAQANDCVTVSRFPIITSFNVESNLAVYLNTTAALGHVMLAFNAHLPCCANDAGRQWQIDAIMNVIRGAKQPGGGITLDPGTPMMISGDLNLVGDAQQLKTVLEGDIVNQGAFGPSFDPDWDDSPLTFVWPRQTEKRMGYTWYSETSWFQPGHLDYHIYTDSALEIGQSYTLFTPNMSGAKLAQHGLQTDDSLASDHLLFIVDVRPVADPVPGDLNHDGVVDVFDLLILIGAWGPCDDPNDCPADITGPENKPDGVVDVFDLLKLIANWG